MCFVLFCLFLSSVFLFFCAGGIGLAFLLEFLECRIYIIIIIIPIITITD